MRVELLPHQQRPMELQCIRTINRKKDDLEFARNIYNNWEGPEYENRRLRYTKAQYYELFIKAVEEEIKYYEYKLSNIRAGFINE